MARREEHSTKGGALRSARSCSLYVDSCPAPCRPATLPATAPRLHGRTVGVQLGACSCLQCARATHRAAVLDDQCDTYAAERQTCSVEYAMWRVQHASGCSPCGISRASIPVCADVARCVCEYSHLSARPRFTFAHRLRTVTQARTVTPLEALGPALVALRANGASHLYRQDSLPCTATAENTGTANNSSVGPVPPSRRRYRQVIRQLSDDNVALRMSQQSATLQAHSAAPLGLLSVSSCAVSRPSAGWSRPSAAALQATAV